MDNLFMEAAKNKYRFESRKGLLMVEDLFDLPLESAKGADLNSVAQAVDAELEKKRTKSFVNTSKDTARNLLEGKLEVVKAVIAVKEAEQEKSRKRTAYLQERNQLLNALEARKQNDLAGASAEDLEKRLAELEASL